MLLLNLILRRASAARGNLSCFWRSRWSCPPGSSRLMPSSSRMMRVFCSCMDFPGAFAPCTSSAAPSLIASRRVYCICRIFLTSWHFLSPMRLHDA